MATFNRTAAVKYAKQYALTYNSDYISYPSDCTNFVSQALLAGGWTMVKGSRKSERVWYYSSGLLSSPSYTWGGADNFAGFLAYSGRGSVIGDPLQLDPGDVLQIADDSDHVWHTMIVTGKGSDLLLSYHTHDTLNKPLSVVRSLVKSGYFIAWKLADVFA